MSSQLSPPHPQQSQCQPPLLASGACHSLIPGSHPLPAASPRLAQPFREPMPPGSSPSPRRKFLALPQAPPCSKFLWQEAREPPWLLIHPTASPRSPQSHWESRGPPLPASCPGNEGGTFSTSRELPTVFPGSQRRISQEENLRASGDMSSLPTWYPSNQIPPAPHRLQGLKGKTELRQGQERVRSPRSPIQSCLPPVPTLFPQPLSALDLRGSHPELPLALFSSLWASRRYC